MASNDKGLEEIPESTYLLTCGPAQREDSWLRLIVSPVVIKTFLNAADLFLLIAQIESNYDEVTDSFDSMNLKAELLRGALYIECGKAPRD